ncbi:MAG: ABC transporter permease [Chloroflexota bacterium]
MNPRLVLAIARKDVVDAARNLYLLGAIAMPLAFWLLFRFILPGEGAAQLGGIAVYDQGSSRLVTLLAADPLVKSVVRVGSEAELAETAGSDAVGGLSIPAGFDEAVAAGQSPALTVLVNGKRGGGELLAFRRIVESRLQALAGRPPVATIVQLEAGADAGAAAAATNGQAGLMILFLIMGLAMTGAFVVPTLLVEEKEKHTLKTMLVSPASYGDVVAGKAVAGLFYALLGAAALVLLYGGLGLDPLLAALAIGLGGLVLVEIGLLMGAFFATTAQVNSWSSFVLLALIMPSWLANLPLPGPMQTAMRLLPTFYVADLMEHAGGRIGYTNPWFSTAVLVGAAVVLFALIIWSLRRSEN